MNGSEQWPPLPLQEWQDTYRTLHMWTQIVGKIRMTLSPPLNHWWHVTLYVNSRGLTTGPVPYPPGIFEIQLDFQKHEVTISTSQDTRAARPLRAESVADFYRALFEALASLGISAFAASKGLGCWLQNFTSHGVGSTPVTAKIMS